jgi:hypothetical protein
MRWLNNGVNMLAHEERQAWREEYEEGKQCDSYLLELYRHHRDDPLWRSSREVEKLCEYILFLEDGWGNG